MIAAVPEPDDLPEQARGEVREPGPRRLVTRRSLVGFTALAVLAVGLLYHGGHHPAGSLEGQAIWFVVFVVLITAALFVVKALVRPSGRQAVRHHAGNGRVTAGSWGGQAAAWGSDRLARFAPAEPGPVEKGAQLTWTPVPDDRAPAGGRRHAQPSRGGAGPRPAARPPGRGRRRVPEHWRAAVAVVADLDPETGDVLTNAVRSEVAGAQGYGEALDELCQTLITGKGYDPKAVVELAKAGEFYRDAAAQLSKGVDKVVEFYEDHIRHAADGDLAPHDGRHFTGDET